MKPSTTRILSALRVLAWIIFIGLCIRTGAILYSAFVSIAINPAGSKNLYAGLDLSNLHQFSTAHYLILISFIVIISALKALMTYLVLKTFLKINYATPFSPEVSNLISGISYVAFAIGLITLAGNGYCNWLTKNGVSLPSLERFVGEGGVHLFFAGIIFFIAQVFKRGIEIQTENELTV